MAAYYYDCEFLEGKQDKRILGFKYGETKHLIDLISIGIVSEDNREYYAISKDFNLYEAWNRYDLLEANINKNHSMNGRKEYWIRENVLRPIFYELINKDINFHNYDNLFTYKYFKKLINKHGKTNKQIAEEVRDFCYKGCDWNYPNKEGEIKFYGYYSDYDHVVLCQLFGKMIDLPKGFPMYTIDLKQESDKIYNIKKEEYIKEGGKNFINKLSNHPNYPKQTNEHNALSDAKWNKELHKFINNLI